VDAFNMSLFAPFVSIKFDKARLDVFAFDKFTLGFKDVGQRVGFVTLDGLFPGHASFGSQERSIEIVSIRDAGEVIKFFELFIALFFSRGPAPLFPRTVPFIACHAKKPCTAPSRRGLEAILLNGLRCSRVTSPGMKRGRASLSMQKAYTRTYQGGCSRGRTQQDAFSFCVGRFGLSSLQAGILLIASHGIGGHPAHATGIVVVGIAIVVDIAEIGG
jgi:hypothetical protein